MSRIGPSDQSFILKNSRYKPGEMYGLRIIHSKLKLDSPVLIAPQASKSFEI